MPTQRLLETVYAELRKLAAYRMAQEAPGHTLQPTALVHEAWLRLISPEERPRFQNRAHFFGAAAEAMRRILVESARRKKRLKHGGRMERVDVEAVEIPLPMPDDELLALDEALDRLVHVDARAAEVVKLCFFVGLTQETGGEGTRRVAGHGGTFVGICAGMAVARDGEGSRRCFFRHEFYEGIHGLTSHEQSKGRSSSPMKMASADRLIEMFNEAKARPTDAERAALRGGGLRQ